MQGNERPAAPAVPPHLKQAVLSRIAAFERRRARWRAAGFAGAFLASGVGLMYSVSYAMSQAYLSGFGEYARLALTDRDVVLASWREFALSLIDSLPATALLLTVVALFALVWSGARAADGARELFVETALVS